MKTTPRGFKVYGEFTDTRGLEVSLQESSADPLVHAYLFVRGDGVYDPSKKHEICQHAPHLDVEQAKLLIAALQAFVADKSEGEATPFSGKWVTRAGELEGKTIARVASSGYGGDNPNTTDLEVVVFTDGTAARITTYSEESNARIDHKFRGGVFELDSVLADHADQHVAVRAGLMTADQVRESIREMDERHARHAEETDRKRYEELKKKFEGGK